MEIPKFDAAAFAANYNEHAAVNVTEIRNVSEPRRFNPIHPESVMVEFDATFDVPHKMARYMAIGSNVVALNNKVHTPEDKAELVNTIEGYFGSYIYISPRVTFAPSNGPGYMNRTRVNHGSAVINPGGAYPETHIGRAFCIAQDSVAMVGIVGDRISIANDSQVSATRIGSGTQIGYRTSVGVTEPKPAQARSRMPFQMQPFSTTEIGDGVEIGNRIRIGNGVTIGDQVYIDTNIADNSVIKGHNNS